MFRNFFGPKTPKVFNVNEKTSLASSVVGLPAKVIRFSLTQSGTNAPVAIIYENTTGIIPTFNYIGVGDYTMTMTNAFAIPTTYVPNRTRFRIHDVVSVNVLQYAQIDGFYSGIDTSTFSIKSVLITNLYTGDFSNLGGQIVAPANSIINGDTFEIIIVT